MIGVVVLCAALIVTVDLAPASAGPTASVAKKKCSKKKRKHGKCGKSATGPVAELTALLAGSSFSSAGKDPTAGSNATYSNEFKFCRNGTYQNRSETIGTTGGTPYDWVTTYGGAWTITDAKRRQTGELAGGIFITITSWQDSRGRPQPLPSQGISVVIPADESYAVIGEAPLWTPHPGGAGC